jgi:hypothetical protein
MSQKRKIIDLLLERYPGYATNFELNKICFRYGGRIKDLRDDGWEIENEPVKENRQEWRAKLLKPYNEKSITKTKTENRLRDHSHQEETEEASQMHLLQPTGNHLPSLHSSRQKQLFEM